MDKQEQADVLMNAAVQELHTKLEEIGFEDPVLYLAFRFDEGERRVTQTLTNAPHVDLAAIALSATTRLVSEAEKDGVEFPEETKQKMNELIIDMPKESTNEH